MNRRLDLWVVIGMMSIGLMVQVMGTPASAQTSERRPFANLGPVDIDFGAINVGELKSVPVTVRNLTTQTLDVSGGGININGFSGSLGNCPVSIPAGTTCTMAYRFRPLAGDGLEVTGTTGLSLSAGSEFQSFPISLRGRGVGTLVELTPNTIDFGNTFLGQTSTVPITVTNTRDTALVFNVGLFSPAGGFVLSGGTCGGSLAPAASCQFNATYTPGQLGQVSNQTVVTASITVQGQTWTEDYPIAVRGQGVNTVGLVHLRPPSIGFGKVKLGKRASVPIRYTNTAASSVDLGGGGFSQIGSDGGAFQALGVAPGMGCSGSAVAVGATCSISYALRPHELRAFNGNTSITFFVQNVFQPEPLTFTGTGVGALAQVSPLLVDFGTVDIGTIIGVPVTVVNDGDTPLINFIGGSVSAPFSGSTNCTGTLAVGASCVYTFRFQATPTSLGAHETQTGITFTNEQGLQPVHTITLRARGTAVLFSSGFE
ncbi:MAG: choice-of-anchor D domain-containing protein [Ahniella sp.]|nr:choice-of-anchor D domain-containing protein [Ahniella sp.]